GRWIERARGADPPRPPLTLRSGGSVDAGYVLSFLDSYLADPSDSHGKSESERLRRWLEERRDQALMWLGFGAYMPAHAVGNQLIQRARSRKGSKKVSPTAYPLGVRVRSELAVPLTGEERADLEAV